MINVIGIAWYKDEARTAGRLRSLPIPKICPPVLKTGRPLWKRNAKLIKDSGNIAIRADIDPDTFTAWCASRGLEANSRGRIAFVNHVKLEYEMTGKGTVIE